MPDPDPVAEIHNIAVPAIVNAILTPMIDAGGTTADVLDLLESVAATVIALAVMPPGDVKVVSTFAGNVARKLAMMRLAASEPAGSG
jgi:Mg/Co/Ni transporter MgtE